MSDVKTAKIADSSSRSSSQNSHVENASLISKRAIAPLLAGLSGGTVSTVLLLPLDNVKVRLQVNEGVKARKKNIPPPTNSSTITDVSSYVKHRRLGAIRMMRYVVKHEGIQGLYQGLTPAVIGSAVSWGGFFYVYEAMKRQLRNYKSTRESSENSNTTTTTTTATLNSWDNFQVATLSGMVMVFVTNPVWLIKLRMQLQMKKTAEQLHVGTVTQYNGFFDAVQKIVKQEGPFALYKGTGAALLLTSHGGVQLVVYEFLRKYFHYVKAQRNDDNPHSSSVMKRFEDSLGYLTMGAIAKMTASTVTYPLQVVKSRMQQPSSTFELTDSGDVRFVKRGYSGLLSTLKRIQKKEGISGFFKGAIPNAVRVAPSAAVTFVVYETVMDTLQVR